MANENEDTGSSQVMGWDDFLKHSPRSSGGEFLENWREDGLIDVWLHPGSGVAGRWAHKFWEVRKKKDKEGVEVEQVSFIRWVCHEPEVVLKKQRYRDDDGEREMPPTRCPACLLIEHVRSLIEKGQLDWTAPLFRFRVVEKGQVVEEETILAGGYANLFGMPSDKMREYLRQLGKKLGKNPVEYEEAQMTALRRAGVDRRESYKWNGYAKFDYILRVVPNNDPGLGIQIAPVADALGEKIQKEIKKRSVATKGKFNPNVDPLCVRWEYDEDKDFKDMYEVTPLPEEPLTEPLKKALAMKAPDIADMIKPGHPGELRKLMEAACLISMPWDDFFGKADASGDQTKGEPWDAAREASKQQRAAAQEPLVLQPSVAAKVDADGREFDKDGVELVGCECCGKAMRMTDTTCPSCGARYNGYTGALEHDPRKATPPEPPKVEAPAGPPPARRARRATST